MSKAQVTCKFSEFQSLVVCSNFYGWNHIECHRYAKEEVYKTFICTLGPLWKSALHNTSISATSETVIMTHLGACGPLPRGGLCIYNSGDTYNDRWPLEWSNMLGAVQKANVLSLSKLSLIIVFLFHSLTSLHYASSHVNRHFFDNQCIDCRRLQF